MRRFLIFILITALSALLASVCAASGVITDNANVSEAVSILEECEGEPDERQREYLHGLGLSDDDIDGLYAVKNMRKGKTDVIPYLLTAAAAAAMCVAAVICVKGLRKKQTE